MTSVVVVGAGCFGAWTAFHLAEAGHGVTLVDAYGPGNARASSGGETRIIRMGYGAQELYTRWSLRSLRLWKALCARANTTLFHETGVLWMAREHDALTAATLATLERAGVPHERLPRVMLEARWPQIDFGELAWAIHEPESGVLMARRAVETVAREAARSGARYVQTAVQPPRPVRRGALDAISMQSGEAVSADTFVFACGPWLPKVFPALLGDRIFATRQEVLYFGPPAGDTRFAPPALPAWIDFGAEIYGIPDIEARGFKISFDRHGPPFDPDTGDRIAGETTPAVRDYLARRFPALRDAPLVASEVCQYENTCNGDFLIDRHPEMENVWLVGGGSGHGFKHGPAVGEHVARLVTEGGAVDERFSLVTKERVQKRAVY
jgi:monomeric sarcosine oxidase